MLKFSNGQNQELKTAIKDRYLGSLGLRVALKRKSLFLREVLLDFSSVGFTDENECIRPYRFMDIIHRFSSRYEFDYGNPLAEISSEFARRLGENVSKEDVLNYVDINVTEAKASFNKALTRSVKNRPTFKFENYTGSVAGQMFSGSYNAYSQRILKKGNFYTEGHIMVQYNAILEGTSIMRFDFRKGINQEGVFQDDYRFGFIPIYDLIDDGIYKESTFCSLKDSKFIIQVHKMDKDSAIRLLSLYKSNVNLDNVSSYMNFYDDTNLLWNRFAVEKYKSVQILEVFWKDYETDRSEGFKWMRSFFAYKDNDFDEIVTTESPYPYGQPFLKHKHELTVGTPYGYTDTPNNVNTNNAKNTVYSALFHKTRRDSHDKILYSSRLMNLKDHEGAYWNPYKDQSFYLSNLIGLGQSVSNYVQKVPPFPMDPQALNIINQASAEQSRLSDVPSFNPSRMTRSAMDKYLEFSGEAFQPMFISDTVFLTELGEMAYSLIRSYTEEERSTIRSQLEAAGEAIDIMFDIDEELPEEYVNAGISVTLSSEEEVLKNKAFENLLPILDRFGVEVLVDENLIQLFDLRTIGYALPKDKERMTFLKDLYLIKSGRVKRTEIKELILSTTLREQAQVMEGTIPFEPQEDQVMVDYNIQDHSLAVATIKQWMNENKFEFKRLDEEIQDSILLYFKYHLEAEAANQQKAMAMQQQAQQMASGATPPPEGTVPAEQAQGQQEALPPELEAMLQQQAAPV